MVEQSAVNRSVAGSNPACGANHGDKMSQDKTNENPAFELAENIPDSANIYKQSHAAWILPALTWSVVLVLIATFTGIFATDPTGGLLPFLFAAGIALPRYYKWSQTIFYISEDSFYLKGSGLPFQKRKIFRIPLNTIESIKTNFGMFGRTLGYGDVVITFIDKRQSRLQFIQKSTQMSEEIGSKTGLNVNEVDENDEDES